MRTWRRFFAARARLPERALGAVRPGVEALLLAAVALGCAQAGWSALSPHIAYGSAEGAPPGDANPLRQATAEDVQSPFAPAAAGGETHAAAALLASVKLAGVRVAEDAARSGAILSLEDGVQHAFLVGQQVSAGVRLAEVRADYVLLAYEGGQAQITMAPAPVFSYARALMGQAPEEPAAADAAALAQTSATVASAGDAAWLAATLAQVETVDGQGAGWRVASPAPAAAIAAGLREGDFIVEVNGRGPERMMEALSAAASGRVELSIIRGAGERMRLTLAADSPA